MEESWKYLTISYYITDICQVQEHKVTLVKLNLKLVSYSLTINMSSIRIKSMAYSRSTSQKASYLKECIITLQVICLGTTSADKVVPIMPMGIWFSKLYSKTTSMNLWWLAKAELCSVAKTTCLDRKHISNSSKFSSRKLYGIQWVVQ